MKTLSGIAIAIVLVVIGFAAGFPVGKSIGFETGSEWALVQAKILARESNSFMPVYLADGEFRIVIKQPRNLYRNAWKLADQHHDKYGSFRSTVKLQESALQSTTDENRSPDILRVANRAIR